MKPTPSPSNNNTIMTKRAIAHAGITRGFSVGTSAGLGAGLLTPGKVASGPVADELIFYIRLYKK
jgi:hypothetical protein